MYRIGVDVGGTNTDSAILDVNACNTPSRGVLASSKSPTTPDITSGIYNAVEKVLARSEARRSDVLSVAIGTTHFVNAVVEADERRLSKVAVVRLCGPYTRQLPPFIDFPASLKSIIEGPVYYLDGGFDIDGKVIALLDAKKIEEVAQSIKEAGITAVAVVGVFSPLDYAGAQEEKCKSILLGIDPTLLITCSRDIGPPGFLERENATILNTAILSVARRTIEGFRMAMLSLGLSCRLYLSQNDGTLTDVASALDFPIKTFASGPTNSAMGAAYLAGLDNPSIATKCGATPQQIIVVDIGGTTTDVCALLPSGFPRQAPGFVEVGGVRTAFSMPEVASIGLGGGSIVEIDNSTGALTIGPNSVGHLITSKSMIFGGDTMTTTDVVVALGKHRLGNASLVANIPKHTLVKAHLKMKNMIESVIENMRVSTAPVTALLVGGGSILIQDDLEGVVRCVRPPHHDAANAVGAAIAQIAADVDVIEVMEGQTEREVLQRATAKAIEAAIRKGAARNNVRVVAIDKIPLQYVSNKATRFIIKAVGRLEAPDGITPDHTPSHSPKTGTLDGIEHEVDESQNFKVREEVQTLFTKPSSQIEIPTYKPDVRSGVWYLSDIDLEFIASGTGVLGTGGGGQSYLSYLASLESLRRHEPGRIRVISPKALRDSDTVAFGSWYGAPSVFSERLPGGDEIIRAIDAVTRVTGHLDFQALIADEIGGGNGMAAFPIGAYYDRPVIDADCMGRAYPTMEHSTIYINGFPIAPIAIADAGGNVSVVMESESNNRLEKTLRQISIGLGLGTAVSARPLPGNVIKAFTVPNTISQAWYLGRAVHLARKAKTSYVEAVFETNPGRLLFTGKILDVRRDIQSGYTMGTCIIAPVTDDEDDGSQNVARNRFLKVPFQNEYLYAALTDSQGLEDIEVICTVPDLISILDVDGEAIGSQDLRYGLRVNVIGMPAHPLWTASEAGMRVGGPQYFGLEMTWKSVGTYQAPRSVIDDFNI